MASTYSDLKIELIGTGEQVGTWGATTNANLGTALEEAIVGSADVAFSSADVTITLTNTNASQSARHLRLNLTGTSGGARNLILGSGCQIDKPYIINNGLADTVTVKNTTGTGVAVPAGKSMWVYNNGTNVVEAMTYAGSLSVGALSAGTLTLNTLTLNTLTLNTPLSVSSGGTGVATLTGVVKGNGTSAFTAGTVSLTSEITGTLPVANGGTGQTTYTNGQLLIGNTTGNTLTKATLTAGTGITITNSTGSITIASSVGELPAGVVMYFAADTAPTGYLKANGANVSRSTYAALFSAIGTTFGSGDGSTTFGLPDMRGQFPRGWDDGRGLDSGRAFGSSQSDAIRNINGTYNASRLGISNATTATGPFFNDTSNATTGAGDSSGTSFGIGFDASRQVPTASENRPTNVALLACIKF